MKIGILTYHRAHNYGAVLQAFALQTYIIERGHKAEIIDYWPNYHHIDYNFFPRISNKISIKGNIKILILFLIGFFRILKRHKGYLNFVKKRFNLPSKPLYATIESTNVCTYDLVIYGSDQIWRKQNYPEFKGFDEIYFGSYPIGIQKKVLYAVSMGNINLQNEDYAFIKRMTKNFNALSVREADLQDMLKKLTGREVSLVLDPVFLLDRDKWIEFLPKRKVKKKYILLYQIIPSEDSILLTKKLKEYYGYKVFEIRGRVESLLFDHRYKQTESPMEFLSLLKNAEFVITTSFHGTAFSVIFEKQFYALNMGIFAERVLTLLNSIGIENRYLNKIENVDFEDTIEYSTVNKKLEVIRNFSLRYINHALKDE
jgi:hypothetical protein